MARYATEISIKGEVYTIKDLAAHTLLSAKADLDENGFLKVSQLPATVVTKTLLDTSLSTKANISDLKNYVTVAGANTLIRDSLSNYTTTVQGMLNKALENTATKAELNTLSYNISKNEELLSVIQTNFDELEDLVLIKADVDYLDENFYTKTDIDNIVNNIEDPVIDYVLLRNKPAINGKQLLGNLTLKDLGLSPIPKKLSDLENDLDIVSEEQDPIYQADRPLLATKDFVRAQVNRQQPAITINAPIEFKKEDLVNQQLELPLNLYPTATVTAVSVITERGEEFLPLLQNNGVAEIIKQRDKGQLLLIFGDINKTWDIGYVYLTQFMVIDLPADSFSVDNQVLYIDNFNNDAYPSITNKVLNLASDDHFEITVVDGQLRITSKK